MRSVHWLCIPLALLLFLPAPGDAAEAAPQWALALHGGAGVIPKSLPQAQQESYFRSLRAALDLGARILAEGGDSLDAVESVVRLLEDDPLFNAGRGAVYNHDGRHELDAAIMDGRDLSCGAVAGLRRVRNPVSLARMVMERTPHVFLAGDGAEAFAREMGVPRVNQSYFHTDRREQAWRDALRDERAPGNREPEEKGTVGAVARDVRGNLAAATSTGGLTNKKHGRIGDVPVIGAGTYASNGTCAVSGTGQGEEFIRHGVAARISALMQYRGLGVQEAAEEVVLRTLRPGDGGIIAVDAAGTIALAFNSEGMFRGAADSGGRFEVRIWE